MRIKEEKGEGKAGNILTEAPVASLPPGGKRGPNGLNMAASFSQQPSSQVSQVNFRHSFQNLKGPTA